MELGQGPYRSVKSSNGTYQPDSVQLDHWHAIPPKAERHPIPITVIRRASMATGASRRSDWSIAALGALYQLLYSRGPLV